LSRLSANNSTRRHESIIPYGTCGDLPARLQYLVPRPRPWSSLDDLTPRRGLAYPASSHNPASGRNSRVPKAGNARTLRVASRGQVPPFVDGGGHARLPAARSGQGHGRAGGCLPTPGRGEDTLHRLPAPDRQSGPAVTSTRGPTGPAVPAPNGCPPCPSGERPSLDGPAGFDSRQGGFDVGAKLNSC
jgi:hypothetical protein